MTGVIERVDCEVSSQLRHDLLEKIELRAQCMEKDEIRACPRLDVANLYAADVRVLDGNVGGPDQPCRLLWCRPQRFHDVRDDDERNDERKSADEYLRQAHGPAPAIRV